LPYNNVSQDYQRFSVGKGITIRPYQKLAGTVKVGKSTSNASTIVEVIVEQQEADLCSRRQYCLQPVQYMLLLQSWKLAI
jgi:hypothetical protein